MRGGNSSSRGCGEVAPWLLFGGQSTRRISARVAFSLVASSDSSRVEGFCMRNREEGREMSGLVGECSAVDLELDVVGPALR